MIIGAVIKIIFETIWFLKYIIFSKINENFYLLSGFKIKLFLIKDVFMFNISLYYAYVYF